MFFTLPSILSYSSSQSVELHHEIRGGEEPLLFTARCLREPAGSMDDVWKCCQCGLNIHRPKKMIPYHCGDPLTFPLVPLLDKNSPLVKDKECQI